MLDLFLFFETPAFHKNISTSVASMWLLYGISYPTQHVSIKNSCNMTAQNSNFIVIEKRHVNTSR